MSEEQAEIVAPTERELAVQKFRRDRYGLLPDVPYVFDDMGSINWRALVSDKYLYVNKGWFESRGKEAPDSIAGLKDNQLLIMLGGIRELAKVRGFESLKFEVVESSKERAVVSCSMYFTPNYENPDGMNYSEVANATIENTDGFGEKFLEAFAANRAFIRCVRNFLNVNIVGFDEIDKSAGKVFDKSEIKKNSTTAQGALEKHAKKAGYESFEEFVPFMKQLKESGLYKYDKANAGTKKWESFEDVHPKEARKLISAINKWLKEEKGE